MNKQKIITWVLFFLIFFAFSQLLSKNKTPAPELTGQTIGIKTTKTDYAGGEEVIATVRNNGTTPITIPSSCPKNPLKVSFLVADKFSEKVAETKIKCENFPDITIAANAEHKISFSYWNHTLFGDLGKYKVEVKMPGTTTETFASAEFTVSAPGFWRKLFRTIFYQPLYNVLIFLIKIAPGRDLGFAIIMLTLLIRLILLVPSQRAIVSQKRMQELQPKLEQVKKKYAGNQERIAAETMQLWKEHKVNPLGSCLPILVQFPVLIALFYVIQSGLNPDNTYLLYSPLKNVDLSNLHTNFLGILDLTKANAFVLPIIVGALQFFQLKLATVKKAKENEKNDEKAPASEMESASKMMAYIMPVMIAMFTASVPAGVGLYWGVSTAFAIGQQVVVNKKKTS